MFLLSACGGSTEHSDHPAQIVLNAPEAPDATVAYREDGAAAWTVLTPKDGRYAIPTPVDAYTVVVACVPSKQVTLYELHATDLDSFTHQDPCRASVPMTSGSVTGTTYGARLYWGDTFSYTDSSNKYVLFSAGRHDLVAVRNAADPQQALRANRFVVMRDVEGASTGLAVDLSDTSGKATEAIPVTGVVYGDRSTATLASYLLTANGTRAQLSDQLLEPAPPTIDVVPQASLETGDLNLVVTLNAGLDVLRVEERAARNMSGTVAVTFAPPNMTFKPEVGWDAIQPYVMLHTYWRPEPSSTMYRFTARQTAIDGELRWTINTTTPVVDASGAFSWILPDLSGLPGWAPQLGFKTQSLIYWQAVSRSGADLDQLLQSYPTREGVIETWGFFNRVAAPPF